MKHLFFCLFLLLSASAFAQIGASGTYVKPVAPDWETLFSGSDRYAFGPDFQVPPSYRVGLDYWLRLKNYRVEFFPTVAMAQFHWEQAPLQAVEPVENTQFKMNVWSFYAHTSVYPFDFEGDCHCPTWSKQNPFFKKGFFVQVSPGVALTRFSVAEAGNGTFEASNTAFSLGAGVGLDIGLSDFITLTPFARVTRNFNVQWQGLGERLNTSSETAVEQSNVDQIEAGIRLGLRWKE